jgi:hypothetical protein
VKTLSCHEGGELGNVNPDMESDAIQVRGQENIYHALLRANAKVVKRAKPSSEFHHWRGTVESERIVMSSNELALSTYFRELCRSSMRFLVPETEIGREQMIMIV